MYLDLFVSLEGSMSTGYAKEGQVSVGFGEHCEVLSERRGACHVFFSLSACSLRFFIHLGDIFFLFDGSVEMRVFSFFCMWKLDCEKSILQERKLRLLG